MFQIKEITDNRFERVNLLVDEYISNNKLPGIITLIYQKNQIIHCSKKGLHNVEQNTLLTFDGIYNIASMTKPIVCTAALMLYEEGKLALADPISKFLPKAKDIKVYTSGEGKNIKTEPINQEITILDLFTHTSGFTYGYENDPSYELYKSIDWDNFTLEKFVDTLLDIPLRFQPATHWVYSFSTDILGRILEIVSGKPLDEFLHHRLFSKLNMYDTGYFVPKEKWSRIVPIYRKNEKGQFIDDKEAFEKSKTKPSLILGGGKLFSTLSDYLRFTIMLLNKGMFNQTTLIKPETVELMSRDHVVSRNITYQRPNPELFSNFPEPYASNIKQNFAGYGYGLGVGVKIQKGLVPSKIYGWSGFYNTYFWIDPTNHLIGIRLSQFFPNYQYPINHEFTTQTYQGLAMY